MSDFDKLKDMNLKDIEKITKISATRLRDIINKNFEAIDSTRAYGFIRILERDLHLELKDWLKEYNEYRQIPNTESNPANIEKPKNIESNTQNRAQTPSIDSNISNIRIESQPRVDSNIRTESNTPPKIEIQRIETTPKPQRHKKQNIEISTPKAKNGAKKQGVLIAAAAILVGIVAFVVFLLKDSNTIEESKIAEQNQTQKLQIEEHIKQTQQKIDQDRKSVV